MKKKILFLLMLLLIVVVAIYFYAYKDHRNIADSTTDFTFSIEQLQKEFVANDSLATTKYQDKVIEIKGNVTAVEAESKSIVVDEKMYAAFDNTLPTTLKVGQSVKLKGRFLGYDDLLEEFKMDQTSIIE